MELYSESLYKSLNVPETFVQDNYSTSVKNVLRGLHYTKKPQAQLLTVLDGKIFDVVVDIRKESKTFGQWFGTFLTSFGKSQIYMAPGFAHGFYVMSNHAYINYKVSQFYDPTDNHGIAWDDSTLKIKWPCNSPLVSTRDSQFGTFNEVLI